MDTSNTQLRKTNLDIVGDVPWGTHFCMFYQNKQDLVEILLPYFKAGLENNEFCMCVTSEPFNNEEAINTFRENIPGFDGYVKKGQMLVIPYTEWYTAQGGFDSDRVLSGWVEKLNRALEAGYEGLRLTGNTFWLEKKDWKKFTDYENQVNRVIGNYKMLAICTYSLEKCAAIEIMDVVSNHGFSLIKHDGGWQSIESSSVKLAEEKVAENERMFRAVLANSPVTVSRLDRDLRFTWVYNPKYGLNPEDYIGKTESEIFPEKDAARETAPALGSICCN